MVGRGFTWIADLPPPTETKIGDDATNGGTATKIIWDRTDDLLSRYWPRRRDGYSFHQKQKRQQEQEEDNGGGGEGEGGDVSDDNDENSHAFTYGEVTPLGVRQLMYEMGLFTTIFKISSSSSSKPQQTTSWTTPSSMMMENIDPDRIVFMDVGSGVGKLVVQIFLEYIEPTLALENRQQGQQEREQKEVLEATSLRTHPQVIGVELSKQRHEVALEAWNGVARELQLANVDSGTRGEGNGDVHSRCTGSSDKCDTCQQPHQTRAEGDDQDDDRDESSSNVQFIHANALDVNFRNVTHIFMSSLCFPEEVLKEIQLKLLKDAKKLQVVASLNRLDELLRITTTTRTRNGENYIEWKERIVPIQMSWGPSTAKIYHRVSLDATDD